MTRFVRTKDVRDVAEFLDPPRDFALEESILLQTRRRTLNVVIRRQHARADFTAWPASGWNQARTRHEKRTKAVPVARAGSSGNDVVERGNDGIHRRDIRRISRRRAGGRLCGRSWRRRLRSNADAGSSEGNDYE